MHLSTKYFLTYSTHEINAENFFSLVADNIDDIVASTDLDAFNNRVFITNTVYKLAKKNPSNLQAIVQRLFNLLKTTPITETTAQKMTRFTTELISNAPKVFTLDTPIQPTECTIKPIIPAAAAAIVSDVPARTAPAFSVENFSGRVDEVITDLQNANGVDGYSLAIIIIDSLITPKDWQNLNDEQQQSVTDSIRRLYKKIDSLTTNEDVTNQLETLVSKYRWTPTPSAPPAPPGLFAQLAAAQPTISQSGSNGFFANSAQKSTSWDLFAAQTERETIVDPKNLTALQNALETQRSAQKKGLFSNLLTSKVTTQDGSKVPVDNLKDTFCTLLLNRINGIKNMSTKTLCQAVQRAMYEAKNIIDGTNAERLEQGAEILMMVDSAFMSMAHTLCSNSKGGMFGVFNAIGTALNIPNFGDTIQREMQATPNKTAAAGKHH